VERGHQRHQQRCAEADRENRGLHNIADPRKDCGSFIDEKLRRYVVETLTYKVNISI